MNNKTILIGSGLAAAGARLEALIAETGKDVVIVDTDTEEGKRFIAEEKHMKAALEADTKVTYTKSIEPVQMLNPFFHFVPGPNNFGASYKPNQRKIRQKIRNNPSLKRKYNK